MRCLRQSSKICIPQGGESDPNNTQGKDSNCTMTDVKQSGNTVKFKGTCVTQGESINMTMLSSGKYRGGSCDIDGKKAEGQVKIAQAQNQERMNKMCDISGMSTKDLIASSGLYIDKRPACLGKIETGMIRRSLLLNNAMNSLW